MAELEQQLRQDHHHSDWMTMGQMGRRREGATRLTEKPRERWNRACANGVWCKQALEEAEALCRQVLEAAEDTGQQNPHGVGYWAYGVHRGKSGERHTGHCNCVYLDDHDYGSDRNESGGHHGCRTGHGKNDLGCENARDAETENDNEMIVSSHNHP